MELPLVGRDRQLNLLVRAMTDRRGANLLVVGPAGVGKTRLLTETSERARAAGAEVHWAAATPATAPLPFGALAHLLPPDADIANLASTLAAMSATLLRDVNRPTALVVDDLPLLDPGSATLLHHLATSTRIAVVATARTGEPDVALPQWGDRVELSPLEKEEIAGALSAALEGPVESGLLARLMELSAGNPLMLIELVDAALAEGSLELRGGLWQATGSLVKATTLPAAVRAHLGRLDETVRSGAELVALGEPLGTALVERLLTLEAVIALDEQRLLAPVPDARRHIVGLVHPLYGEALRATAPPLRAREHRRRLADALEATGMRRVRDILQVALWRLEAGQWWEPDRFLAAARQAAAARDHDLAARLAQASLDAGGSDEAEIVLIGALPYRGHAREALERAHRIAQRSDDEATKVKLGLISANIQLAQGLVAEAQQALSDVVASIKTPELRTRVLVARAGHALAVGNMTQSLELGEPVAAGPMNDSREVAGLASSRVRALCCAGRAADALEFGDRALDLLDESEDASDAQRSFVLMARLQAVAFSGHVADAIELGRTEVEISLRGRTAALRAYWTHDLAQASMMAGHARHARRSLREAIALLPIEGVPATAQLWGLDALAEASAILGDVDEASAAVARLEESLPAGFVAPRRSGTVWSIAARGEIRRARREARAQADRFCEVGSKMMAAWTLYTAARLGGAAEVTTDLALLAARCQGSLVPLWTEAAAALAADDGPALDDLSVRFAQRGYDLWGAETAAAAARIHRAKGRKGSALAAANRFRSLASRCEGVRTPMLTDVVGSTDLTPREWEIAGLAARGLSDREIAERLHLSVRTVHSHLYSSYRKLQISERAELVDIFHPS